MWELGQMDVWGNGHLGANGHFRTDELWSKSALGANGHLGKWAAGKMSTRANRQLGQIGTLRQMGIRD